MTSRHWPGTCARRQFTCDLNERFLVVEADTDDAVLDAIRDGAVDERLGLLRIEQGRHRLEELFTPAAVTGRSMASALSSVIYDLGYQGYNGPRLGRRHAVIALVRVQPAGDLRVRQVRLGKAARRSASSASRCSPPSSSSASQRSLRRTSILRLPEDYYGLIQPLIVVFCALIAPDLVGRDQRTQVTLALLLARAAAGGLRAGEVRRVRHLRPGAHGHPTAPNGVWQRGGLGGLLRVLYVTTRATSRRFSRAACCCRAWSPA